MPRWATIYQARIPRKALPPSAVRQLRVLYARGPFQSPEEQYYALMIDSYLSTPGGVPAEKVRSFVLDEYVTTPGAKASDKVRSYAIDDHETEPSGAEGRRTNVILVNQYSNLVFGPQPTISKGDHDGTDITLTIDTGNQLLPNPDELRIYRSTTQGGGYSQIQSIPNPSGTESFTDTNVSSGTFYFYVATTVSSDGIEGTISNELAMKIGTVEVELNVRRQQVPASVSNFPLYVDLSDLPDYWWANVTSGGDDARVYNKFGTGLPREIVWFDAANRQGAMYFKADSIPGGSDTAFTVESGSGNAAPSPTDPLGRNAVWSNGFHRVYHFADDPSDGNLLDSTGNTNGSVNGSMGSGDLQTAVGLTGARWDFDATDDYVRLPITFGWGGGNDWTMIAIFEADAEPSSHYDLLKSDSDADEPIRLNSGPQLEALDENATLSAFTYEVGSPEIAAVTYDNSAGETRVLGNGTPDGSTTNIAWDAGGDIDVFRQFSGEWGDGKVEEIRVVTVERTDDWIDLHRRNLRRTRRFYEVRLP